MEPTYYEILKTEYGLTDEDIEALISAGVLQGELETTERDMTFYEDMAQTRTPRGRGFGGVYVSADPLEFAGAGLQSAAGHYGRYREDQERRKAQEELAELRKLFIKGRQPATTPAAPPVDPGVIVGGPRR